MFTIVYNFCFVIIHLIVTPPNVKIYFQNIFSKYKIIGAERIFSSLDVFLYLTNFVFSLIYTFLFHFFISLKSHFSKAYVQIA